MLFFIALGYFEWLPGDPTEGEEDHEVSLLWVTDEVRPLQEEVDCCLSEGSISTHSILAEECTVGCRWRILHKLPSPVRWRIVHEALAMNHIMWWEGLDLSVEH